MTIKNILHFASWPVAIGVIIALAALQFFPNLRATQTANPTKETTAPFSYADAVSHAAPAVVTINTFKKNNAGNIVRAPLGSGVVVDKSGIILTNNHVINGIDNIQVQLNDAREATAQVIGVDTENDLAVLKIKFDNLFPITIGQSNNLRVGDVVLAIGNPYGVGQSVSQGIVSALGRYGAGLRISNTEFIQTDAAINPGNSGGALVDAQGNLIGINTAMLDENGSASVGISFAVPTDVAINSLKQILQYGEIKRVWLGFSVGLARTDATHVRLYVSEIQANSPVAIAGMQVEDIILKINNVEINDVPGAKKIISTIEMGNDISIEVMRRGVLKELRLKAQALPPQTQ